MAETWKPIQGWEGLYSVSNLGRVRRDKRGVGTFAGKLLCGGRNSDGYLQVGLHCAPTNIHKRKTVASLVAEAFIGPRPSGYQANHINGIKTDNRAKNLEWVTRLENVRHSIEVLGKKHGRTGSNNGRATINEGDARRIRKLSATRRIPEIAKLMGVSRDIVGRVVRGTNWRIA